jgi:hypothetical protein
MHHAIKTQLLPMIKHLADTVPGLILGGISLSTMGTLISMVSGLAALFYTGLKIYEFFEGRCKNKSDNKSE